MLKLSSDLIPSGSYHPGRDALTFPPIPRGQQPREALGSFDRRRFTTCPALNCRGSIGDKGISHRVSESIHKDSNGYDNFASFPKFVTSRPRRVDRVITSGEPIDKSVVTPSGVGHAPLRHTGGGRATTFKDRSRLGQRPMGWVGRLNPVPDPAFAPERLGMPTVSPMPSPQGVSLRRPPPMHMPPPTPMHMQISPYRTHMGPPSPTPLVPLVNTRPKPQCWEHGCNGRQFSTFSNLLRHQREKHGQATNGIFQNSSDGSDGTKGITSTISKDSSADECVRQAKLLADMGERLRNGKDTESSGSIDKEEGAQEEINKQRQRLQREREAAVRTGHWEDPSILETERLKLEIKQLQQKRRDEELKRRIQQEERRRQQLEYVRNEAKKNYRN